jgi:hypothetical protein
MDSTLVMSEYGERMQWSCQLPNIDFDPGDGCPIVLRINCLNSVDMSTSLEVTLSWFRLICGNGMMFGLNDTRLHKRHIRSLDPSDVAAFIQEQLSHVETEKGVYRAWFSKAITLERTAQWVDDTIAREWGPHSAARVWHIIADGADGEVQPANDKRLPHELELKSSVPVPGTPQTARNLFHASQALSWVAGTRKNIREQLEYIMAVPSLVNSLLDLGTDSGPSHQT